MKWNEMSTVRKMLFVIGGFCAAVYLTLRVLVIYDIINQPRVVMTALIAMYCLGFGVSQSNRIMRAVFYVLTVLGFALALVEYYVFVI